jgi:hypothetical protein
MIWKEALWFVGRYCSSMSLEKLKRPRNMSFRTKPRAQRYTNSPSRGGVTSSSNSQSCPISKHLDVLERTKIWSRDPKHRSTELARAAANYATDRPTQTCFRGNLLGVYPSCALFTQHLGFSQPTSFLFLVTFHVWQNSNILE